MKHIIFSVMITCWAALSVAQQLESGVSLGFRAISSGQVQFQHVTLEINNPRDERSLVPSVTYLSGKLNQWQFKGDIQYQTGGISLRVFDQSFMNCPLCPVKKGSLVSYSELMFGGFALFGFIKKNSWDVQFGGGLAWNYRFKIAHSPTDGLTQLSLDALLLLSSAAGIPERSYLNGRLETRITWRRWTLAYQYIFLLDKSMAGSVDYKGTPYPLHLDQRIQLAGIHYRWLSF